MAADFSMVLGFALAVWVVFFKMMVFVVLEITNVPIVNALPQEWTFRHGQVDLEPPVTDGLSGQQELWSVWPPPCYVRLHHLLAESSMRCLFGES